MCQSKAKGGKRCFTHSLTTKATSLQVSKTTGIPEPVVTQVMRDLRQEGAGNESPSRAEVLAHAQRQKFNIMNDDALSEHDKKILMNRWDKAKTEEIDGGAWHAIKNALGETLKRWSKRIVAGFAIGAMAFTLTGCGGTGKDDPAPSPSDTVTIAPSQEPTEPTPTETGTAPEGVSFSPGILVGDTVNDGKGEYRSLVLDPDSDLANTLPAKVTDGVRARYSDAEILEAQKEASDFFVTEVLDADLSDNATPEARQAWWDQNSTRFASAAQADAKEAILNKPDAAGLVILNGGGVSRGTPVYDAAKPKYSQLEVSLNMVEESSDPTSIRFVYGFNGDRPVTETNDAGKPLKEVNTGVYIVTTTPDNGAWKIGGWNSTYDVRPEEVS